MTNVRMLIDVDGVLNAVCNQHYPEDWGDWKSQIADGFPISYSPEMGRRLNALATTEGVEPIWLTTWGEQANEHIAPLFGWDHWRVLPKEGLLKMKFSGWADYSDTGWWKFDRARDLYYRDVVPFVWVDDDFGPFDAGAADWAESVGALTIRPNSYTGISEAQMDEIETFVYSHLDDRSTDGVE
jgi:hypothetical protein